VRKRRYSLDDFAAVKSTKTYIRSDLDVDTLPSIDDVEKLAHWTKDMADLFEVDRETAKGPEFDRSGALQRMAYEGAEQQWENEQILAVLLHLDDRWQKYSTRRDRLSRYLIPMVDRARSKLGYDGLDYDLQGITGGRTEVVEDDHDDIWGFDDFTKADFPIDWQLDGLLAHEGIGLVVGYPGTGKTQFTLGMSCHLALGQEGFLRWTNVGGKRRKVLFMSLEMGRSPLHHFVTQIGKGYDDPRTLNKNLLLAPLGVPIALDKKEGVAYLSNLLETYQPDVVVFDSLQRMLSKELTDEVTVKTLFDTLALVRQKYECSMVIVHHHRKKSNDGQKKNGVELSDVFGSVYITASVDFVLSLRKVDDQSDLLKVETLKNRLARETSSFEIMRDENLAFTEEFETLMKGFRDEEETGVGLGI
jgi:hypothetical protein